MLRGKQRHSKQKGMVATESQVETCGQCGALVSALVIYEGWCFSCVVRWGHPDDAAVVQVLTHGWDLESAKAVLFDSVKHEASPEAVAVQSIAQIEQLDSHKSIAYLQFERRGGAVAGDGFLYDDEHGPGRWTNEAREYFQQALKNLFEAGLSIRAISRITGISRITIRFYREKFRSHVRACVCGRPATHQTWCRPRFRASRKRQDFMKTWHPTREWPYAPVDGFALAWQSEVCRDVATEVSIAPSASAAQS